MTSLKKMKRNAYRERHLKQEVPEKIPVKENKKTLFQRVVKFLINIFK